VYRKAVAAVEEGKTRGSLTLRGLEEEVRVNGRRRVVRVVERGVVLEEGRGGKKFLRIEITAEVDGARSDYTITYGRYKADNTCRRCRLILADGVFGKMTHLVHVRLDSEISFSASGKGLY
jgi:polyisoprenoid-binding protein YceI